MESIENATKEELIDTIESMQEENEKAKKELMEKLRKLEGEQLKSNISNR